MAIQLCHHKGDRFVIYGDDGTPHCALCDLEKSWAEIAVLKIKNDDLKARLNAAVAALEEIDAMRWRELDATATDERRMKRAIEIAHNGLTATGGYV